MANHIAAAGVASLLIGVSVSIAAPVTASTYGHEFPLSPLSQQNAVSKASDYLDYTAFSRKGLIQQLAFDGFSIADATYAVDSIAVDWNEQAAKKAVDYLNYTSFSRSGLIDQLVFDGFTPAQAQYGVATTGL
jgi:SOS response regulatory protein OraA/RecX